MKKLLLCLGLSLVLSAPAQAVPGIVLYVDTTNLSAVTLTVAGNLSLASNSTFSMRDGFDLLGFFTSDHFIAGAVTDNLTPAAGGSIYDSFISDSTSGSNLDLNFYRFLDTETSEVFSTSSVAFAGTATFDLSGSQSAMPSVGTLGNLVAGNAGNISVPIGQYVVVPEPSVTPVLSGASILGLVLLKRRRA
jgi:hypothetical protein